MTLEVTVNNPLANICPAAIDYVTVTVANQNEGRFTCDLSLPETGVNTGIFDTKAPIVAPNADTNANDCAKGDLPGQPNDVIIVTYSYPAGVLGTKTETGHALIVGPQPTTTKVACVPASFAAGATTSCTAAAMGFSGSITGETITWSKTAGTGSVTFSGGGTCALSAGGTCSITATGVNAGSVAVQASYPGDANNRASAGTDGITNNATTTTTTTTTTPEFNSSALLLALLVTLSIVGTLPRFMTKRPLR
jgi:hypothetical protein